MIWYLINGKKEEVCYLRAVESHDLPRHAGFTFSPDGHNYGIMTRLGRLLRDVGCFHRQRAHVIDFSSGAAAHETMYQNCLVVFQLVQPFCSRWGSRQKKKWKNVTMRQLLRFPLCLVTVIATILLL